METPSGKVGSSRPRRFIKVGALVAVFAITLSGAIWLLTPRLTESLLTSQIERVEERTGLDIEVGSLQTTGLDGLELRDLTISLPGTDTPLGTIAEIDAAADLWQAARGRPAVTALEIRDVHFTFHRRSDGTSDIDDILAGLRGDDDEEEEEEDPFASSDGILNGAVDRLLRHFGGSYPDLLVIDAVLEFTHDEEAEPWPVRRVSTDEFSMDGSASDAAFATTVIVDAPETADLRLPERIDLSGAMRLPADRSVVAVDLEPELRIANLSRLPYTEISISGFEIADGQNVEITKPRLDSRLDDEARRLASAERVRAKLGDWPRSRSDINVMELEVDTPRVFVEYSANGASNISELYTIARQTTAGGVTATAQSTINAIVAENLDDDDDGADDSAQDEPPQGIADRFASRLKELPIQTVLMEYLPQETTLRDIRLVVEDRREHEDLTAPAPNFEIAGEVMELSHRPLQGTIEGNFKFHTRAGDDEGHADVQFHIPYRRGDWNASVDIDRLQLAHFSQLGGPAIANRIHGGLITATLDVHNDGNANGEVTHFEGLLAAEETRVHFGAIAEDPIEIPSASLSLDGFYDPLMEVPVPELITQGYSVPEDEPDDDESEEEDSAADEEVAEEEFEDPPPDRGAFIVEKAVARLSELEGEMTFGIYGVDGLRRPNRTTLSVDLETTPINTIIDAVPTALRGPLDGLDIRGDLTWQFALEVPLYKAADMAWDTNVELSEDLEVIHIPDAVDVFKLVDEFEHTITDEWSDEVRYRERDFFYERTITIPEMRPTPVTWILDNTALDLETIDEVRREREWPEVPEWNDGLGLTREELEDPEFWLSDLALDTAAPAPWQKEEEESAGLRFWDDWGENENENDIDDDEEALVFEEPEPLQYHEVEVHIDPDRHGPYVYVPLQHISPYMVRAIMTTEDTSFFRHSGFNYLAIRQSAEANLEAGRYVRGASTISMQLTKNLFLERSRVLSRKLQEVALVWLMESVADIPKERLMELYLNVIEFGPGIYGIYEASTYYFGKYPDQLTISEVAWLVSIVPNPKRYHQYYASGEINDYWFRRMSRYIRAMKWRERITEEEMESALEDHPEFYIPEDGDPLLREDAGEAPEAIAPEAIDEIDGPAEEADKPFRLPLFD